MTGLILYGDTTLEFEIWKLSWHFPDVFIVSVVSLKLNSVFNHPPPPPFSVFLTTGEIGPIIQQKKQPANKRPFK